MKRILTVGILLALIFTMAACQTKTEPVTSPTSGDEPVVATTTAADEPAETQKTHETDLHQADGTTRKPKAEKTTVETTERTTKGRRTKSKTTTKSRTTIMTTTTTTTTRRRADITIPTTKPTAKRTYPASGQLKVACVGDSITAGGYWSNNLQRCLPTDRYTVLGFGVSGTTGLYSGLDWNSATGAFDVPKAYVNEQKYRQSLAAGADIVVVMLGTNDSKDYNWNQLKGDPSQYIADMTNLVRSYQDSASKPTVLLALPPTAFSDTARINNTTIEKEIIPALRQVASYTNVTIVDTHAANARAQAHFTDGVHPSDATGRKLLAEKVAQAVLKEVGD